MPTDDTAARGERLIRRLIFSILVLAFLPLAALAVYVFLKKPHIDYSATNRIADLIYLATWLTIVAAGALACLWRRGMAIGFAALLLLLAETGAQAYLYVTNGALYQPEPPPFEQKFEPHPLLVGIPRPGYFTGIVHDANNRRRTDNPGKAPDAKVIFALGSSTTYDLANNDRQTWESDLSRLLGPGFAVENLGVPGYSSVENLIQTLFVFRSKAPACAIYFEGIDLRNAHIDGLADDYSDFHLPLQRFNLGLAYPGFLVNNLLFLRTAIDVIAPGRPAAKGTTSGKVDPRLSQIYGENMRLIGENARHFGVKAIFVPAVANWPMMEGSHSHGWYPFVEFKDVKSLLTALSQDMKKAADDSGAVYVDAPLKLNWTRDDFFDSVHFNAAGAQKFAASIAPAIAELCR